MERYRKTIYDTDERQILAQVDAEIRAADPTAERCRFVSFVSQSAGRGRRRTPREVAFLVMDGRAYQVIQDEVKGGRHKMRPDTLAMEILEDSPPDQRSIEDLLQSVKRASR